MSCGPSSSAVSPTPPRAGATQAEQRPTLEETTLRTGERLWIYTPPSNGPVKDVILVAPAGSNLVTGMSLSEGDQPEHVPYAEAGYVVFAYSIPGELDASSDAGQMMQALRAFRDSDAGLVTARAALDEANARYPNLVADGVLMAGHSSAATHALYVASQEPRVRAVAAYAPAINVPAHVGADFVGAIEQVSPGHAAFLARISPVACTSELAQKPVLLFSAKDDELTAGQADQLANAIRATGTATMLEHVVVETGGHYDSMLDEGIPAALDWFETLRP